MATKRSGTTTRKAAGSKQSPHKSSRASAPGRPAGRGPKPFTQRGEKSGTSLTEGRKVYGPRKSFVGSKKPSTFSDSRSENTEETSRPSRFPEESRGEPRRSKAPFAGKPGQFRAPFGDRPGQARGQTEERPNRGRPPVRRKAGPTRTPYAEKPSFRKPDYDAAGMEPPKRGRLGFRKQDDFISLPKRPFEERRLHIWGRRPVEAILSDLAQAESVKTDKYMLHVIVDKAGKAPAQLKESVTQAQGLGIKVKTHKSMEDEWPLGVDDSLNHQRIALLVPSIPTQDIYKATAIVKEAAANKVKGCVGVVLDQIQDPRNFGAILRTAAFFGAKFVIYASDRQADLSPLVLKTSAGGAFSLVLVPVVNLSRALDQLKDAGAWTVGTLIDKPTAISDIPLDRPFVVILGNEGKGIRPELAKRCDFEASIPGGVGTVDSLNVSVAAGVVLSYLAVRAVEAKPSSDE